MQALFSTSPKRWRTTSPPLRRVHGWLTRSYISSAQLASVQESREIHRRSSVLCTAVYLQGGLAAQEQPINSLAWKEPFHQSFLTRCSCHFVSTPACKFGLDWYKTWAVAATSEKIHLLAGNCQHHTHYSIRGKRLPDGTYISSLAAEYPSLMASAIVEILRPWVSQNSHCYNPILQWKTLLAKQPISRGPRITDGAGDISSANWTIPFCQDIFKAVRQKWCTRNSHPVQTPSYPCHTVQSETHYRSLCFRRGTHPLPPGSTRLFPFRNTRCLNPTFSTISTAALPGTLGSLPRPRSPYRRTPARWYPIWSIHPFGTYQPLGEECSSTGGYTRSPHLSG